MNNHSSKSIYIHLVFIFLIFILNGCSSDDDNTSPTNSFYSNALTTAQKSDLVGVWAIFEVGYQNETISVPNENGECGRDFFIYQDTGVYSQYVYSGSSDCSFEDINTNWELNQGIITLSNGFEEIVIVKLTQDEFVFKVQFDVDEDGVLDILTATAKPYIIPNAVENYEYLFSLNTNSEHNDKIRFDWMPYNGFYEFDKYEIYRNVDCDKSKNELYLTITDKDKTFFIEETPPNTNESFCYFLKVYTSQGLLGESSLQYTNGDHLFIDNIEMNAPLVSGNTIILDWNPYEGRYFSHYEITAKNYINGSGHKYQEEFVVRIDDKEITSYTDNNPLYIVNPVYTIHAYDIFGNKSFYDVENENTWEVSYKRDEVLEQNFIQKFEIDSDGPILYFYGKTDYSSSYKIYKYNYETLQIEATSKEPINNSNLLDMKMFESSFGKELFYAVGSELYVFDAENLDLKYKLKVENKYVNFDDYLFIKDNLWILTDSDKVYTATRDHANLTVIDEQIHFQEHQGSYNYQILDINDISVLIGHIYETKSIKFSFDNVGIFTEKNNVNIEFDYGLKKKLIYNEDANYILNLKDRLIYNASDFSFVKSFTTPNTPTAFTTNGSLILGSNNDEEWSIDDNSPHEKKVSIFNISNATTENYNTIGYPLYVFENYLGEIISISSGLKRESLSSSSPRPDIFIEKVK